jgi:hypothetical protein
MVTIKPYETIAVKHREVVQLRDRRVKARAEKEVARELLTQSRELLEQMQAG